MKIKIIRDLFGSYELFCNLVSFLALKMRNGGDGYDVLSCLRGMVGVS